MRVLVAPCSFKESLTATAAARVLGDVARALGHDVVEAPLADGGEGTLDALAGPLGLEMRTSVVEPMLPSLPPVRARFGFFGDLAVLEAASVVGLGLLPQAKRDPLRATTRGLGQLMNAACDLGARRLWIGVGGTATIDGGAGLLSVYDRRCEITGLVDVDVPLAGAREFMAQKFAGPVDDAVLDERTAILRELFRPYVAHMKGAGAGGGLGAALASLGARLVSGAETVLREARIDEQVAAADLVLTGEGRIDEQTARGKLVAALARLCAAHQRRLVAFCGDTRGDLSALRAEIVVVTPPGTALDDALAGAGANLAAAARRMLAPG